MPPVFMTVQHSRVGAGKVVMVQVAALELHSPTSRSGVSDVATSQQFDSGESVAIFLLFELPASGLSSSGVWGLGSLGVQALGAGHGTLDARYSPQDKGTAVIEALHSRRPKVPDHRSIEIAYS